MSAAPLYHASLIVEAGHRLRVSAVAECAALYFYHKARASGSTIDASVSEMTLFNPSISLSSLSPSFCPLLAYS